MLMFHDMEHQSSPLLFGRKGQSGPEILTVSDRIMYKGKDLVDKTIVLYIFCTCGEKNKAVFIQPDSGELEPSVKYV